MFAEIFDWWKIHIVSFFVFEIKDTKEIKLFKFSNDRFSVTGALMDIIFGVFLQTSLRPLKSIILQLSQKYSKTYNNLNVKNA